MSKIMNWMMGEAEAGRFQFREPPDYPDDAEYHGLGMTYGEYCNMMDGAPKDPEWTDEELNDFEHQCADWEQKKNFIPFELDEVPF